MITITEDYVSFETAKLLKDKGFDEPCYQCYVLFDKFVETSYYEFAVNSKLIKFERLYADEQPLINSKGFRDFINNKDKSRVFAVPTQQMAMRWLREVYNLCLFVIPATIDKTFRTGYALYPQCDSEWEWCASKNDRSKATFGFNINKKYCDSYEQACETAIKYCLENLI